MRKLERRVVAAAEKALADHHYVSAVDVLVGVRWLHTSHVDVWRQGRVASLEHLAAVDAARVGVAMAILHRWALDRGLVPSETEYVARTRDRRPLRFSSSGNDVIERAFRIQWSSPDLPETQRERLIEKAGRPPDLVVIWPLKDWTCRICGTTSGDLLIMDGPGPVCMTCADLDHLVFLPSGNAALTRRAKKASRLSAVVVRFSRARRRYERQGILVEEEALASAETSCLAAEEVRRRLRERAEEARAAHDEAFHEAFAAEIARLFPGCPPERAAGIARHAGARHSGRVGRSAAGRALDEQAVSLAVVAAVRHVDTDYDDLLMMGTDRAEARARVHDDVDSVLTGWRERT
ncbi:MAG TPA: DUF2293 domain-containing protein [Acidimicrobiia bacterium]|jgi:hypothetical protein